MFAENARTVKAENPDDVELCGTGDQSGTARLRAAVFIDARSAREFTNGSVTGAQNAPLEDVSSGKAKISLPEDDFNRRIILVGRDATQAPQLADLLSKRPWHNVSYFPGSFDAIRTELAGQ